jgi:hypothetical protein
MLEAECTSSAKMKPNGSTKQVINNLTYWSLLGSLPETRVAELSGKVKHAPAEIKKAVAHIKQDHSTYANRSGFFNLPMHVDSQAQCLYWKKGPFKPAEFSCTRTHTSKEIQNALIERSKEQNAAAAHTSYGYIVKNWRINPLHITKLINQKCQAHERYLKNVEKNLFNEMNNF